MILGLFDPTLDSTCFCIRYHGHFLDGQRSGYGVMFYATGARYEGEWVADKKQVY